jgi:hypothetical protein
MVGHQAVAHHGKAVLKGILAQELEEEDAVGVSVEDIAAVVTALGKMMRESRNNNAAAARHLRYSLKS